MLVRNSSETQANTRQTYMRVTNFYAAVSRDCNWSRWSVRPPVRSLQALKSNTKKF